MSATRPGGETGRDGVLESAIQYKLQHGGAGCCSRMAGWPSAIMSNEISTVLTVLSSYVLGLPPLFGI